MSWIALAGGVVWGALVGWLFFRALWRACVRDARRAAAGPGRFLRLAVTAAALALAAPFGVFALAGELLGFWWARRRALARYAGGASWS